MWTLLSPVLSLLLLSSLQIASTVRIIAVEACSRITLLDLVPLGDREKG